MMTQDEIKEYIFSIAPTVSFDETGEWLNIIVDATQLKLLMTALRTGKMQMDYLFCLTCVDVKTHLTMVYHLSATTHRQSMVIKANVSREQHSIETLCDIWRTADFLEREVFEMFGVTFLNHPDLRRLILEDDFKGFPLLKDFEDPINMIKL
ncbi:MAG: NADH-quinone oxidoreductase subunit C [Bacteroidetes bacterium]|nr:NADH-quinone oxidoreductase subunit C [Bacteroidota bacterium]